MRKLYSAIIVVSIFGIVFGFNIKDSNCGSIPVIDAANLAEQLRQYLQELQEFQEMLNQTEILDEEYFQMLTDYQQVLREYQHYLNQMKSIRHMIDAKDWSRLMRMIKSYYGDDIRAVIASMDPENENYEEEVDEVLGNYGHVPRDPSAIKADAQALGIWSDQYGREVEQDYRNFNIYKDRMRMVSNNALESSKRQSLIGEHADIIQNLGDESELATMQEMATQNILIMNQLEAQIQLQNQILMNMEMQEAIKAAKNAKAREAELSRLKNRKPTKLLGRDRWGSF